MFEEQEMTYPWLVDGGYLAWVYGPDRDKQLSFINQAWMRYSTRVNCVIVQDGGQLERTKYYPDYKSKRRERYKEDAARLAKKEMVGHFINILNDHPYVNTLKVPGLEADDIVTALPMRHYEPLTVVGTDKDLIQLGEHQIHLIRKNQFVTDVPYFASGQAKTIQPAITQPYHVLMILSVLGDKSDSIPRLLPTGIKALRTFVPMLESENPFRECYDRFGEEFKRNLYISILPGPWVFKDVPTDDEVLSLMIEEPELYYEQALTDELEEFYLTNILAKVPSQEAINERFQWW